MALSIPIITEYVGTGLDKFKKELAQAETKSQKAGLLIKKAFIPATAALGGLAAAALDSAKAAMEDEAQQKLLASQLRKTTGATDKQIEATEDYIGKQLRLKGFTDSQLRPAFEKLARATGDLEQAQRLTNTAMDIATATGKPLETVVASLEKAYGGNMGAIQRLLPEYREMIKEGGSFEDVMGKIEEKLGGAASEAALTAEGRFKILKEQLGEVQEEIGYGFIPVLEKLLPFLLDMADWAQENPDKFRNIALAIGAIAASTVALNLAMAVNPYVAAASGIVAMALAFEHLYREASKINKIGGLAARVLGFVFGGVSGRIGSMLKISDTIYDAILPGGGSKTTGGTGGLRGDLMKELKGIPAMADGGIVTGPTLALIGEAGPEAVVPLDRYNGGGGGDVNIYVQGADPNAVVDALRTYMFRNGSVPIRVS